jgi:serine/threonine protein kinase
VWYGPVNAEKLAKIVRCLKRLHDKKYVHGDVRLQNMVLHEGVLTDFDFARVQGSLYSSTLANIEGDEVRHPDVAAAIVEQAAFDNDKQDYMRASKRGRHPKSSTRLGLLEMQFIPDVYAMKYVLKKFWPFDNDRRAAWVEIVQSEDLWSMPAWLEKFDGEVEFTGEMNASSSSSSNQPNQPSGGTGNPPQV